MRIIDLLNKIAKGEEVPNKIKYRNNIYIKDNEGLDFYVRDFGTTLLLEEINDTNYLTAKIEIIEEEKEIEELPIIKNADNTTSLQGKDYNYTMKTVDVILANKINELVREIRKLKDKE